MVLETADLNATELSEYCRERGLFPEQVVRWRQATQDANAKQRLHMWPTGKISRSGITRISGRSNGCSRNCAARKKSWRKQQLF